MPPIHTSYTYPIIIDEKFKKDTHTYVKVSALVSIAVAVIKYLEKQYNGKRT